MKVLLIIMHLSMTSVSGPYATEMDCIKAAIQAQAIRYHLPDYHIGCTLPHTAPWKIEGPSPEWRPLDPWRFK